MRCRIQEQERRSVSYSIRQWIQKISDMALLLAGLSLAMVPSEVGASVPRAALQPNQAPPGATVSLSGKGLGRFTSVYNNRVTFNGVPALVQRWEPDLIIMDEEQAPAWLPCGA